MYRVAIHLLAAMMKRAVQFPVVVTGHNFGSSYHWANPFPRREHWRYRDSGPPLRTDQLVVGHSSTRLYLMDSIVIPDEVSLGRAPSFPCEGWTGNRR